MYGRMQLLEALPCALRAAILRTGKKADGGCAVAGVGLPVRPMFSCTLWGTAQSQGAVLVLRAVMENIAADAAIRLFSLFFVLPSCVCVCVWM